MFSLFVSAVTLGIFIRMLLPKTSIYRGHESKNFNGKHFLNLDKRETRHGFREFLQWQRTRKSTPWPEWIEGLPSQKPAHRHPGLRFTFINHSTVLVQFAGKNFLTDPVWSHRCSPFSWIGPQRHRPPGLALEALPPIDFALVSHNHYDHMDLDTLQRLDKQFRPKIFTALGTKALLNREKLTEVIEMDWWQSYEIDSDLSVIYVPSQHFSSRSLTDRDKTLWGGFIIHSKNLGSVYFAGDTGFGSHFEQIYKRFQNIRLSLIPIGAYEPQWFMRDFHMNPEDAVRAHLILKSQLSLGIHWGTFKLTDEGIDTPLHDLLKAKKKYNIEDSSFITLNTGESKEVEFFSKLDTPLPPELNQAQNT